ncbi:MAG TPA: F0F1 ATP synthase subunit B [Elusimicrobiota bacterium]|nr:F0F1 ATP synthase subunit B [Elusimicrobiota bacterium]
MENLLNPDIGLMVWTVVTFLCLVFLLGRFAWKPLLAAIEERERRLRNDISAAAQAKESAESLKQQYERQLVQIETRAQEMLAQAQKDGQTIQADLLKKAQDESRKLVEKTRLQLAEEQKELIRELRSEVSQVSMAIAEKVIQRTIDEKIQGELLDEAIEKLADKSRKGPLS